MCDVTIKLGASPSKYWASLEFVDARGRAHRKEIEEKREASRQSNTLEALIAALKALNRPCMLTILTTEDYIHAAFQNEWLTKWQGAGWKNAKGHTVRNVKQWQEVWRLLTPHSRRVIKEIKWQEASWNHREPVSATTAATPGI